MKRLRTGLAASVLAVSLSVGMTAQPAAALTVPPIAPPVLVGGAPAAGGAVVTCVASVVCATAVAAAAATVGLYATRDTWVPMLERFISPDTSQSTPDGGSAGQALIVHSPTLSADGRTLTITASDTRSTGAGIASGVTMNYVCTAGGVMSPWTTTTPATSIASKVSTNWAATCPTGANIVAMYTSNHPSYRSPSNVLRWGSSLYDPGAETYRATAECVKPDGTTQNLVVEFSGSSSTGFPIPSCDAAGVGSHSKSVDVDIKLPGRTDWREAWDVTAPNDPAYPDCDPSLPTSVNCVLQVKVDGVPCVVGAADCVDWMELPTTRTVCAWGPYTVPRVRCDMLERAYRPGGAPISEETTDGNPATAPGVNPNPGPTPTPGTGGTFPTEGPVPTTPPAPVPVPGGGTVTDTSGPNCYPTGSARWNPVEWVYRPVQCALAWAFVPEGGLEPHTARITQAWAGSDVGTWVGDVGGAAGTVGGGVDGISGCEGPVWTIPLGGESYRFAPLDACVAPMSTIAPWVRAAIGALVVIVGIKAVSRPITRSLDLPSAPGV